GQSLDRRADAEGRTRALTVAARHFAFFIFLDLSGLSNRFRLDGRPFQRELGPRFGFLDLVHRHGSHQSLSWFPDDFGHETRSGNGRVGGFSLVQQNPRQAFPGSGARTGQRLCRGRHRRGPCVWNIFRGDAHRAVWLAAILYWSRSAQSLVAIPMDNLDAQGPRLASFTSRANSRHGGNSQTAFSLGNVRRAFCLQLSFLFSAYLAADLSCSRTPFLDSKNGQS